MFFGCTIGCVCRRVESIGGKNLDSLLIHSTNFSHASYLTSSKPFKNVSKTLFFL